VEISPSVCTRSDTCPPYQFRVLSDEEIRRFAVRADGLQEIGPQPATSSGVRRSNPNYFYPPMPTPINNGIMAVSHLNHVVDVEILPQVVDILVERISKSKIDFDAIAFSGMSGCLVGPLVAVALRKQMIFVRRGAKCHSDFTCEGYLRGPRCHYLIVDDLICSGETVRNMHHELIKHWRKHNGHAPLLEIAMPKPTCVGMFMYLDSGGYLDNRYVLEYNDGVSPVEVPLNCVYTPDLIAKTASAVLQPPKNEAL
jgi:hypothetical protein